MRDAYEQYSFEFSQTGSRLVSRAGQGPGEFVLNSDVAIPLKFAQNGVYFVKGSDFAEC